MVVYLSVVNNPQTVVFIADGLMARLKVNNAQPAVAERLATSTRTPGPIEEHSETFRT